jgi:hypothetical protein
VKRKAAATRSAAVSSRTIVRRAARSERKVICRRGELPRAFQIQLAHESRGQAPVMIPSAGRKSIESSPRRRAASVWLRACPGKGQSHRLIPAPGTARSAGAHIDIRVRQSRPRPARRGQTIQRPRLTECGVRRRNPLSQANATSDCNGPAEDRVPWTSQILPAGSARSFVIRRRPGQCAPLKSLTARFLRAIVAEKCGAISTTAPADPRHSP